MKIGFKLALICVISVLFSIIMPAQDLPKLPADNAVSQGVLPNGMTYYIVENPTVKGVADFALSSKNGHDVAVAMQKNVLRIPGVMVSESVAVMDSTLLYLMRKADEGVPADQALVVAGDVSTAAVAEKIRMLSYMTPCRESMALPPYEWIGNDAIIVNTDLSEEKELATIVASWRSPRTAAEYMNTVQPAIYSLFIGELGHVACNRISECFRQTGIPAVNITYRHNDTSVSYGDETFSVSLSVAPAHAEAAVRILSYVMSSLDSGSATAQEVRRAQDKMLIDMYKGVSGPVRSNEEYIDRCLSAFLHNGSLASGRSIYDFHASRRLDDQTSLTLFNDIISALLDKEKNLTLDCTSSSELDPARLSSLFLEAWDKKSGLTWKQKPEADALLRTPDPEVKAKIVSAKKDPISGGNVITVSNGMTVITKNMPADGRVYYSLALNGGYGSISGLSEGEGAFVGDFLSTCRVADVPYRDFVAALNAQGMTMDVKVDVSSTVISGCASKFDIEKVLQAITVLTESSTKDDAAFDYYLSTVPLQIEALKGTAHSRMAAVDSIMCPGYIYSAMKSAGKITPEFPAKAEMFFGRQFSKLDDGVLVISGEFDEVELKKLLTVYGPGFSVAQRSFSRPSIQYQPIAGVASYTVDGDENSIDLAMSARIPLTVDNYAASLITTEVLSHSLMECFDGTGWTPEVRSRLNILPDERYSVVVTLKECGETSMMPMQAMSHLRSSVSRIASSPVDASLLNAVKAHVKASLSLRQSDPMFWNGIIAGRNLYGKDLFTGFDSRADAVTAQKVQSLVSALDHSGKVEYVVTKE